MPVDVQETNKKIPNAIDKMRFMYYNLFFVKLIIIREREVSLCLH